MIAMPPLPSLNSRDFKFLAMSWKSNTKALLGGPYVELFKATSRYFHAQGPVDPMLLVSPANDAKLLQLGEVNFPKEGHIHWAAVGEPRTRITTLKY